MLDGGQKGKGMKSRLPVVWSFCELLRVRSGLWELVADVRSLEETKSKNCKVGCKYSQGLGG